MLKRPLALDFAGHYMICRLMPVALSPVIETAGSNAFSVNPERASHPLHHLLALQFLGVSARDGLARRRLSLKEDDPALASTCERRTTIEIPPADRETHDVRWENRLVELIEHSERSLRSIVHSLQVDPRTVQRYARRLGVWRSEWTTWNQGTPSLKRKNETLKRREQYRSEWRSLQGKHPEEGIAALREWASAGCTSDPGCKR